MGGCAHYCDLTDKNTNNNATDYSNLCNLIRTRTIIVKADSGAMSTYWWEADKHCLSNINLITHQQVTLPNNIKVSSTEGRIINLSEKLSFIAQKVTIIPDLKISSLIALGQLADDNCTILLNKIK